MYINLITDQALGLEHWCNSVLRSSSAEELEGVLYLPQPNTTKDCELTDTCTMETIGRLRNNIIIHYKAYNKIGYDVRGPFSGT